MDVDDRSEPDRSPSRREHATPPVDAGCDAPFRGSNRVHASATHRLPARPQLKMKGNTILNHPLRTSICLLAGTLAIGFSTAAANARPEAPARPAEAVTIFLRTDGSIGPRDALDRVQGSIAPRTRKTVEAATVTRGAADLDDATLDRLLANERAATGRVAPDPRFDAYVTLSAGTDLQGLIASLGELDGVVMVGRAPTPVAPPKAAASMPAEDHESLQNYLRPSANGGIGAIPAWSLGLSGAGVAMCDIEYDFDENHCDLPPIEILGFDPVSPFGDAHGTAVFGEMISLDDGEGTKGIAHGATEIYFSPQYNGSTNDIGAAVYRATAAMPEGSVIVLEVQIGGPNGEYVPMEWWPPYYDAVVNAIANGMVVVQAAGNGGENLDDPIYATGNFGHHPFLAENDSGSIIVGAGAAYPSCWGVSARGKLSFSNYGSRVNLQGYGNCVATLAYGDLENTESCDFTATFSGTSSATPIVSGACMLVQEFARDLLGRNLGCQEIRELLADTGRPQTNASNGNIGPLPDVMAALDALDPPPPPCDADFNGDGFVNGADLGIMMSWFGSGGFPGDLDDDGTINGADLGLFLIQWGPCPE